MELFDAARNPRNCRTHELAPLIHMSTNEPPNAVVQIIDAQMKANEQRIQTGYGGGERRTFRIRRLPVLASSLSLRTSLYTR